MKVVLGEKFARGTTVLIKDRVAARRGFFEPLIGQVVGVVGEGGSGVRARQLVGLIVSKCFFGCAADLEQIDVSGGGVGHGLRRRARHPLRKLVRARCQAKRRRGAVNDLSFDIASGIPCPAPRAVASRAARGRG